jgi:signal transduction histidine kinase
MTEIADVIPSPAGKQKSARGTGSLSRRMIVIAAGWITLLLIGGGIALDRVLTDAVSDNFDDQMEYVLTAMVASAEIDPIGDVRLNRALGDQRFLETNSGIYYQISGKGFEDWPSRSLWDRRLKLPATKHRKPFYYNSNQFPEEPLRVVTRTVTLPDSETEWTFLVAQNLQAYDAQVSSLRTVLVTSFALLGLGLIALAALQTLYGLWPLRDVRREIALMRSGRQDRINESALPDEVMPMVQEMNALIDHNEMQAEEARRHAGNLAHALKTPLTVIMNSATAQANDLSDTVIREATTMRRQVDHHLARARAVGRRGHSHSRSEVWPSLESVERAVGRLYAHVRLDMAGAKNLAVRVERQDLDEMLGNLVENAAKYGGGSVFVTVVEQGDMVEIQIEDDGRGIPEEERTRIFDRGVRLDTSKPGTGLGMAIVRDVAEIYNGAVELDESEDMGGLLVRLRLPKTAG